MGRVLQRPVDDDEAPRLPTRQQVLDAIEEMPGTDAAELADVFNCTQEEIYAAMCGE